MLGEQPANPCKARSILRQLRLSIVFDLDDFLMRAPDDQNVRSVSMLCAFMMVVHHERLFLPCIRSRRGQQNPERVELVLRFRVARPAMENVSHLALHAGL